MRIAVAVSGGGDSLAALLRLREEGHEVLALHGFFLPDPEDARSLRAATGLMRACGEHGVRLHLLDMAESFEKLVAAPFAAEYLSGRTPNPCARCNAAMKFGLLLDKAVGMGAQALATGHYASAGEHAVYGWALSRGADPLKDQSYFLALTKRERLQKALFPLAASRKEAVRADLADQGVTPPLPEESQEICFVPGDDYRAFLAARTPGGEASLPGPGPALLPDGTRVGEHRGLWRYTLGQRRGLGLSWREPLYVLAKDMTANALIVAPQAALLAGGFGAGEANVLVDPALWPEELFVQTRYRGRPVAARAELEGTRLSVRFATPCERPAPGQVAVLYDADGCVLAGAVAD